MNQPLITIGIPTYNRAESLQKYSLSSIETLTYSNYEVIVIDDCSSDETPAILKSFQKRISNFRFFRNDINRGTCYSRNRILEESTGDIIVFLDDDVSFFPDCLDEFAKIYAQDSKILFVWGCVYQCHGEYDRHEPTYGTGSLFSVRRLVAKYFKFDTNLRYFKTYCCDEHEFSRRLKKANIQLLKAAKAQANHYQAPAKNRPWRGLGGDLNFLYEKVKVKQGYLEYYNSLILGFSYTIQYFFKKNRNQYNIDTFSRQHFYTEAVRTFHHIFVLMKEGKLGLASKYLFYVMVDIPIRAWNQDRKEFKYLENFTQKIKIMNNIEG